MVSRETYYSQEPFPHAIIDGFAPTNIINGVYKELTEVWPDHMYAIDANNIATQNLKEFYPYRNAEDDADAYVRRINEMKVKCPHINHLFSELTSDSFLKKLEEMTGIKYLFADPYYAGGGIHKVKSGGHLNVHTDYMLHPVRPWYRRINLLLYLTPNWKYEWGGNFEMWNAECTEKVQDISPVQNRGIIFNTTSKSFHGHPRPLKTPKNINRWSIALYYFTLKAPEGEEEHKTAQWRDV